jgi:hypothetical protein
LVAWIRPGRSTSVLEDVSGVDIPQNQAHIQLWPIRTGDLDGQHITRECPRVGTTHNTKAHVLCSLLNDRRKLAEVTDGAAKQAKLKLFVLWTKLIWSDFD